MGMHHQYPYPQQGYPPYTTPYYSALPPPHHLPHHTAGIYPGMDPFVAPEGLSHYYMPPYEPAAPAPYHPSHSLNFCYASMMPTNEIAESGAVAPMQVSVMQPVAPGIPGKESDSPDAAVKGENE